MTNETYRWVSDPRFHPSGQKLIATKWYTSSRSLGAGEGWEYPLPSKHERIPIGSGSRVVGRTLPEGWSTGFYGQQQIGPEQFIWYGNDSLIFAKNTADTRGTFLYSKGTEQEQYFHPYILFTILFQMFIPEFIPYSCTTRLLPG